MEVYCVCYFTVYSGIETEGNDIVLYLRFSILSPLESLVNDPIGLFEKMVSAVEYNDLHVHVSLCRY